MSGTRPFGLWLIVVLSLSAVVSWFLKVNRPATALFEPQVQSIQSAPLCPWREPAHDLSSFFPTATRYEAETHILSGMRLQLAGRLGRPPTGDENALHVYHIYQQENPLGAIVTQRVKGTYGAIELVLGVDPDGKVRGVRLQRHREPESVAKVLQQSEWLDAFVGKRANDSWKLGADIPAVEEKSRVSADAIVQGVRSMLILLEAANSPDAGNSVLKPHH